MEIKVDVSAETWQKFKMLCTTNKDETAVLTKMVENTWKMAPPEIRKRRGETVDLREEEPKVGLEKGNRYSTATDSNGGNADR